jgi:hypothetical protein
MAPISYASVPNQSKCKAKTPCICYLKPQRIHKGRLALQTEFFKICNGHGQTGCYKVEELEIEILKVKVGKKVDLIFRWSEFGAGCYLVKDG